MRLTRQLFSALIGAVVFAAVLLGAVGPASAHDTAESTSPAAGATVATPPDKVSVTFDHNPLALGSQILVNDASGTNWADGPVEIVDNVAAQKLKAGAPAGLYTVQWRVASSDGHPIEGTFTFTATAAAEGSAATAGTTAAPAVPTAGTAQPGTTQAPAPAPEETPSIPWSVMIFVAVAVGILVALGLMAKRRLTPDQGSVEETRDAGNSTER